MLNQDRLLPTIRGEDNAYRIEHRCLTLPTPGQLDQSGPMD